MQALSKIKRDKIIVGLSGGVDSAVSALLLKQNSWDVEALFMKNWDEDDTDECHAAEDLTQAQRTADILDIPLHTVNFSSEYWNSVFTHFLSEYHSGRTPNPDVLCNKEIKFKAFMDHAKTLGAQYIATGHYADIESSADGYHLIQSHDQDKDQTYFLYLLEQKRLAHTIFPVAHLYKREVRQLAKQYKFPCHDRKDSSGICFIGERRFSNFLAQYLPQHEGDIIDEHGRVIGKHSGCWYATIGQRRGLGIGGTKSGTSKPWYVVEKDIERNTLTVVQNANHPLLFHSKLQACDIHWINQLAKESESLECRIRHRQPLQKCTIRFVGDQDIIIDFEQPQRAISPGQSAVLYRQRECIGGGIIKTALKV